MEKLKNLLITLIVVLIGFQSKGQMNECGVNRVRNLTLKNAERGQLFRDGNYAMFIHWGFILK